jgi:hypothetical protein
MSAKRPNKFLQKDFSVERNFPSETADTTIDLGFDCPAGRTAVIDRVILVPDGALATSDSAYVVAKLLNAAKVAASYSTKLTGGDGAFAAFTQVKPNLSTTATDLAMAAGDKLALFIDVTGAPTVPAGKIRVEGRYL